MSDRYLWDRQGPPDAEIETLETILGTLRHSGKPLRVARPRRRLLLAVAAVLVFCVSAVILIHHLSWAVTPSGEVQLDETEIRSSSRIHTESLLQTGRSAEATVRLGLLGVATVAPDTRIRVEKKGLFESRLALEHGTISARIAAPPRLFYVDTTSAEAIDLGCAYALTIDELTGAGLLRVTHGWVALDGGRERVYVPEGSAVRILGPGRLSVPVRDDAPEPFRAAVDAAVRGLPRIETNRVDELASTATSADALTFWHLIVRAGPDERERLGEVLAGLDPSLDVDVKAVSRGDEREMARLRTRLGAHESQWWTAWARQAVEKLRGGRS